MVRKIPRSLVALSSSAIAAVYFAGLTITRGADADIGSVPAAPPENTPTIVVSPTATLPPVVAAAPPAARRQPRSQPAPASSAPTPVSPTPVASAPSAQARGAYADGTFTGTGTSRRGDVTVSVTVQGG